MDSRVYGKIVEDKEFAPRYYVTLKTASGAIEKVQVEDAVYNLIEELQRELWRMDKEDYRHCVRVGPMLDSFVLKAELTRTPEQILIEEYDRSKLGEALLQIPEKQRRRFLLRYDACLPIKKIAEIEKCTERAVKYSLTLAKSNLKDILDGVVDSDSFDLCS